MSLLGSLLLVACSAPDDRRGDPKKETGDTSLSDTGSADSDDTGPATGVEIGAWESCDLEPGSGDGLALCAPVTLPLDHEDPSRGTLLSLLKRAPSREATSAGQVWLLHGGPGASAVDDLFFLPSGLRARRPDLDLYAIDHRGIGGTGKLECPDQETRASDGGAAITEAEWPDCIAALEARWGPDLDYLNVTQSALDLGALIETQSEPGLPVFVYGGSYGTYLAQRYLQLFPEQASGVVLDGISVPGRGFLGYDQGMDAAGQDLFALCAVDPDCAGHFEGDPWTSAQSLKASFDAGHCPELGTSGDFIRYFLGALLMYDKVRDLVPAAVHRLERCNADDVEVIVQLYLAYTGAVGESPALARRSRRMGPPGLLPGQGEGNDGDGYSMLLFYHVALSEMWYEPGDPQVELADESWQDLTMATGLETWLAARLNSWPRFPVDDLQGALPETGTPMLLLQGGLDAATHAGPALEAAAHYAAPHQTLAFFPQGAHGLINGSTLPDGGNCGEELFHAFLLDPLQKLDLSCIEQTLPVQWLGYKEYNRFFFGTQDVWGDGAHP